MDQKQTLELITKKANSTGRSIVGLFLTPLGLYLFAAGPAGYMEALRPGTYPVGIVEMLIMSGIGLGLTLLGWHMLRTRSKISPQELTATLHLSFYATILEDGKLLIKEEPVKAIISPEGIAVKGTGTQSTLDMTIRWADVQKTEWRAVYTRDAYQVVSGNRILVLSTTPFSQAQSEERKAWWLSLLAGSTASRASQVAVSVDDMKDIGSLMPVHAYARVYAHRVVSRWSGNFERWLFGLLRALAYLTLGTLWLVSLIYGLTGVRSEPIEYTAVAVGFLMVLLSRNVDLRFSQKIIGQKSLV